MSEDEITLALRYIQSNIDNSFKLNLNEQFHEGVNVKIVSDLHLNPLILRFENPMGVVPPKFIKMESDVLRQFSQNQRDREQHLRLIARELDALDTIFKPYESFGMVGTAEGRNQRWRFIEIVDNLIKQNEIDLVELILKAQTTKGLDGLQETLANNSKYSELQTAISAISASKESSFNVAVNDARKNARPTPTRDLWEAANAKENRDLLKVLIRSQVVTDSKDYRARR